MNQNKIQIAIVDDDEGFACALERLFRASGFEVQTYSSAESFVAASPLRRPDCLVLDVHLGGISGLELQRRLRTAGDVAPIIFVTADDSTGVRKEAEQAACSGYFVKPVERDLIIPAIKKAVNRPCTHSTSGADSTGKEAKQRQQQKDDNRKHPHES